MRTKIVTILAFASLFGFANIAAADGWKKTASNSWDRGTVYGHDRHDGWRSRDRNGYRHVHRAPRRHHTLERRVHRRVKNAIIPLRRLFDLDRDYTGYRVDSVIVQLHPRHRRARVKLLVNGDTVDSTVVHRPGTVHLRLDDRRILGRGLHSLKLDLRGKMFVKSIKVKLTQLQRHPHAKPARRKGPIDINEPTAERLAALILRQMYRHWSNN